MAKLKTTTIAACEGQGMKILIINLHSNIKALILKFSE